MKRYTPDDDDVLQGLAILFFGGLVGCCGIALMRMLFGGV